MLVSAGHTQWSMVAYSVTTPCAPRTGRMNLVIFWVLVFASGLQQTAHPRHGAHGVVVSHPLRMRKALGSHPSVSILQAKNPALTIHAPATFASTKRPSRIRRPAILQGKPGAGNDSVGDVCPNTLKPHTGRSNHTGSLRVHSHI